MKKITDLIDSLALEKNIELNDIPTVDLYIDQVIEVFDKNYEEAKRYEKEKILTKTMINNYAKGKLFFPIQNKKYSKEHLMLINLIYQLKGTLSINDIKDTLEPINKKLTQNQFNLDHFYTSYVTLYHKGVDQFKEDIELQTKKVEEVSEINEELERTLLIASLTNMSNLYRRAAEKLVDEMNEEQPED